MLQNLDNLPKKSFLIQDILSFLDFSKQKQIFLKENQNLEIYLFLKDLDQSLNLNLEVFQAKNSTLKIFQIYQNLQDIKVKIVVQSQEENTKTEFYGLVFAKNNNSIELNNKVLHKASFCQSKQIFKFILDQESRGKFDGLIQIFDGLKNIEAVQQNHNLLLKNSAKMVSSPNLKISSPQVICRHGSAMGFLDKEQILYLRARGLNYNQAKKILIQAFANDILEQIPILCRQEKILENLDYCSNSD